MNFNKEISPAKGIASERGNAASIIAPFDNPTAGIFVMEIWRDVLDYEGCYKISNKGRVYSVKRIVDVFNYRRSIGGIVLKTKVNLHGYIDVSLSKNGVVKTHSVHKLVARSFLGEKIKGNQVNHKDGNKQNNNSSNIEWVTAKENINHAIGLGLIKPGLPPVLIGANNPNTKLSTSDVVYARKMYKTGNYSYSILAEKFKVSKSAMMDAIKMRTHKYIKTW